MSADLAGAAAALAVGLAVRLLVPAPAESRLARHRPRGIRWGGRRLLPRQAAPAPDLDAVAELLDRLAALLRAGLGPRTVWEHLAAAPGPCRPVCAYVAESLSSGGDPGTAIAGAAALLAPPVRRSRAAPSPGAVSPADAVRWLAVAMAVSARTGAPAAECVDRLAASVRAETAAADERGGALAGPRATVQVLAWLPAAGVVLGALVGANPVRTLLLTTAGRVCLLTGALLWLAGRTWTRALVRTAERAGT